MEAIWKLIIGGLSGTRKADNRLKQLGADKARKTRISLRKSSPKSEATNLRAGIRDELLKYLVSASAGQITANFGGKRSHAGRWQFFRV